MNSYKKVGRSLHKHDLILQLFVFRYALVWFLKMAGTQDIEFQELNFIFKSLGERGKEIGGLSRLILKHHSELFKKLSPSDTIFGPYGSAAEDLMCYHPDYPGDVDFMIFPNS